MTERINQRTLVAILGALIVVVLLGGVLAAFSGDDPLPAAGARVQLDGVGRVTGADGDPGELHDGDVLGPGAEVELSEGTAVLELAGGGTIEIRAGVGGADDTRVEVGAPTRLLAGDALAAGPAGVSLEAAGTLVTLRGTENAVRIRRELAVTSATYQGAASVDSAGQAEDVPAYRQLAVASVGRTDPEPEPLAIDTNDPWDQRYLGAAIALTSALDSISAVFSAQGGDDRTATDFEAILPRLGDADGFGASLLEDARPDGETLVGAAITSLGTRRAFADRWTEVFAFYDAGAGWGLVALDQGVGDGPLLGEVGAALSRSVSGGGNEAAVGPAITTPPATTPAPTTPTTTATTTTPGAQPTTPPPTTAPPQTVPPEVPEVTLPPEVPALPAPDDGLLQGLLEPVTDLLSGLLGG